MKKLYLILTLLLSFQMITYAQVFKNWEVKSVEQFYKKVKLKDGILGEDGLKISFVFEPVSINKGVYHVKIADYKNGLYEIIGIEYYVKFSGYYGFAANPDEGVLVVEYSPWSSKFYKKP